MWEAECDKYNSFLSPDKASAEFAVGRNLSCLPVQDNELFDGVNCNYILGSSHFAAKCLQTESRIVRFNRKILPVLRT